MILPNRIRYVHHYQKVVGKSKIILYQFHQMGTYIQEIIKVNFSYDQLQRKNAISRISKHEKP